MPRQRAAARMGGQDRGTRCVDAVKESAVRHVRDVDHHAEVVHFCDHFPSEGAQTAPPRPHGRRIGNFIISVVGKRQITDAEPVEKPEQGQRALDRRAVFHSQQDGDSAGGAVGQDVVGRRGERQLGAVPVDGIEHRCRHLQRAARRRIGREGRRCIQSEKGGVHMSGTEFRNVDMPVRVVLGQVKAPHQLTRGITMRINN